MVSKETLFNHGFVISGVPNNFFVIQISAFNCHKTETNRIGTGGANTAGGLVDASMMMMMISSILINATIFA